MNSVFLIHRNQRFPIPLDKDIFSKMSNSVFRSLFQSKNYIVQSDVKESILQSFISYIIDNKIPDIQMENFYEYYLLSQEFGVLQDLIEEKRKLYGDYLINLTSLRYTESRFKDHYIEQISLELDIYLEKYSEALFDLPFNILYNVFYHKQRNLTKVNLAYERIKLKVAESNNNVYFSLLDSLDGNQLSRVNLEECLKKLRERAGFMPKIEFDFLNKMFETQRNNEEQIKMLDGKTSEMNEKISNDLKNEIQNVHDQFYYEIEELKNELKNELNKTIDKFNSLKADMCIMKKELENQKNETKNKNELINKELNKQKNENDMIKQELNYQNNMIRQELNNQSDMIRHELNNQKHELNDQKHELNNQSEMIRHELNNQKHELNNQKQELNNQSDMIKHKTFEIENQIKRSANELTYRFQCMSEDKSKRIMNEITKFKCDIEKFNINQDNKIVFNSIEIKQIKNEINELKKLNKNKLKDSNEFPKDELISFYSKNKELAEFNKINLNSQKNILNEKSINSNAPTVISSKSVILPTEPSISGPGLLKQLKIIEQSPFDPLFVTSLSSCDIYNVIDPNTNDDLGFGGDGDFYIQFELKEEVSINGFKVVSSASHFLRSFDIQVDGKTVKSIKNAKDLNGINKVMKIEIEKTNGRIVKFIQTGPNWDKGSNFVDIKRIEILSDDPKYSKGVFATLIDNCPTKDPHKSSVHITAKNYDFNSYFNCDSQINICSAYKPNSWFQIELTKGKVLINGFRLKRGKLNKMKNYKIIGSDDDKKPLDSWITLIEINETNTNEHKLHDFYKIDQQSKPLKFIRLVQTGPNWNNKNHITFFHFDIFGTYL